MTGEGERDLNRLLADLAPTLDPVHYRFAFAGATPPAALRARALMSFREAEGWTLILPIEAGDGAGGEKAMRLSAPMARVTLTVHSSLQAIGLTAAAARALAEEGISANVVAAYHHDHIFLAAADGARALSVLERLAREARG